MINYRDYLINWIRDEVTKTGANGVVVGISGGIDSALVSCLAKEAFPRNSLGVIMEINSMQQDIEDIQKLIDRNKIQTLTIDLLQTYKSITSAIGVSSMLALANIKPRLRMVTLYAIAQEFNYLVLGTDNADEWLLGYFTKYGDGGVDLLPIVHLTKSEVRNMAISFDVPHSIITKTPSAGLWEGQTDEGEIGFSYDFVDAYIKGQKVPSEVEARILELRAKSEHKRKAIPQPLKPADMIQVF